jgi:hypothetical protein
MPHLELLKLIATIAQQLLQNNKGTNPLPLPFTGEGAAKPRERDVFRAA